MLLHTRALGMLGKYDTESNYTVNKLVGNLNNCYAIVLRDYR